MNWMIKIDFLSDDYDASYDFVLDYPKEEAAILTEALEAWLDTKI